MNNKEHMIFVKCNHNTGREKQLSPCSDMLIISHCCNLLPFIPHHVSPLSVPRSLQVYMNMEAHSCSHLKVLHIQHPRPHFFLKHNRI